MDAADHWPAAALTPAEYERAVARIAETIGPEVSGWQVRHLDAVDGLDGTYVIDVTARFRVAGLDFLVLFECKRHATPVKREHVQVLHAKLAATGAHKGVVVAASGFQSGALQYARAHGIACVRLVDDAWVHVVRDAPVGAPGSAAGPRGTYTAFALTADGDDFSYAPVRRDLLG
ncbi:restriction endonuclease [Dactylosporangium sp. NPDC051541]|uniref:restriction endonuclease n=1 Tax=Dactylosporangium sp. NPDC051541 TaxID=3363977 RepID=UPI00379C2747